MEESSSSAIADGIITEIRFGLANRQEIVYMVELYQHTLIDLLLPKHARHPKIDIKKDSKVKLLPEVDLHGLSWHQHKHIIAFIFGPNHVTICDYEDSEGKDPCVLINELQRDVKLLEWRPNGGRILSVACKWTKQGWDLHLVCFLSWQCSICEIWSYHEHHFWRIWSSVDSSGFSPKS